jgi:hypothetical protein
MPEELEGGPKKTASYWVVATLLIVGALLIVPVLVFQLATRGWSVNGIVGGLFMVLGSIIAFLGAIKPQVFWKYYGVKSPARLPPNGIDSDAERPKECPAACYFTSRSAHTFTRPLGAAGRLGYPWVRANPLA